MKTQALLLSIVTITGLWTLSLCLSHQFHVVYDQMTWTDAQRYCRYEFTDLATVHTLEDVNTLDSMVDDDKLNGVKAVWIGLYNDYNSWRWSLADESFYKDAEEHKFRKWAPDHPSGHLDKLCASIINQDGTGILWYDRFCETNSRMGRMGEFPAICFNDTDPIRKHIVITKKLKWSEAQRECREKHTDLASVRDQAENEEIEKVMKNHTNYWIGLHRDSWKWSDGSSSPFRRWATGEPNNVLGACVKHNPENNKWYDMPCRNKASFVCYSSTVVVKKQVLRVKLTMDSSLDVTSPAVRDAILEQLKQNMKTHQGVPADIKVRWVEQADGRIFHKEDKKKREKKKRERKAVLTKREL